MSKRPLRIAYFDLFHTKPMYEDYSIYPKKYGGGPVLARWAKEMWNSDEMEFKIFAPQKTFENLKPYENKGSCINLEEDMARAILISHHVKKFIPNIDYFDIIIHGHTGISMNCLGCKGTQVHWSGFGKATDGHPLVPYTFTYGDPNQKPAFPNQKIFQVKIGKPVPLLFRENEKEDFVFQCSRHDSSLNSIEVAKECIKNKIKCYFAGPIHEDYINGGEYKLMDYIDNENTFYLGSISEEEKMSYSRRARLSTFLYQVPCAFSQSIIECLSGGTPILTTKLDGCWIKNIMKENVNGFYFDGSNFLECWEKSKDMNQRDCWLSAKEFSVEEMLRTFREGLKFVLKDVYSQDPTRRETIDSLNFQINE